MSKRGPIYSTAIAGVENHTEVIFRFAAWAQQRRSMPTIGEIVEHWGMSRASACRYRRAFRNAGLTTRESQ